MFTVNGAAWIAIVLLVPFWWGMGLLILAWLGDVSPRWRPRISRLFDRLERTRAEWPNDPAISRDSRKVESLAASAVLEALASSEQAAAS